MRSHKSRTTLRSWLTKQVGEIELPLQIPQQSQDHDLHRDVERRGRFVEDQQPRFDRDGPGDPDPRLLPAGELVREAGEQLLRQAGQPRHLLDPSAQCGAGKALQAQQRVGDGAERSEARVEAVGRVLKHHLDLCALWRAAETVRRHPADLLSVKADRAVAGIDETGNQPDDSGFAATRFADKPHRLAPSDGETDALDRMEKGRCRCPLPEPMLADRVELAQPVDGEESLVRCHSGKWQATRRPPPTTRRGSGRSVQSGAARSQRSL
jgi:hypothetical protein